MLAKFSAKIVERTNNSYKTIYQLNNFNSIIPSSWSNQLNYIKKSKKDSLTCFIVFLRMEKASVLYSDKKSELFCLSKPSTTARSFSYNVMYKQKLAKHFAGCW